MTYAVCALYKFVSLPDFEQIQPELKALCQAHKIKGTLLMAKEGLNGTICAADDDMRAFVHELETGPLFHGRLEGWEIKYSTAQEMAFAKMKVRLKKEIVTLGVPGVDPNEVVGTYVAPQDWNAIISDPDTILIDTRNHFEVALGTFKGAIDPRTRAFRDFPAYVEGELDPQKHKKVAMFCTGGIRCEKASAYMLKQGFEEVYHLKGGILAYLEQIPQDQSLYDGSCFVFDERVALGHGLEETPAEVKNRDGLPED